MKKFLNILTVIGKTILMVLWLLLSAVEILYSFLLTLLGLIDKGLEKFNDFIAMLIQCKVKVCKLDKLPFLGDMVALPDRLLSHLAKILLVKMIQYLKRNKLIGDITFDELIDYLYDMYAHDTLHDMTKSVGYHESAIAAIIKQLYRYKKIKEFSLPVGLKITFAKSNIPIDEIDLRIADLVWLFENYAIDCVYESEDYKPLSSYLDVAAQDTDAYQNTYRYVTYKDSDTDKDKKE